ncbi:MAG: rRNA maturation RNase YbeY, partial [Dehalococcoidia bacterium]
HLLGYDHAEAEEERRMRAREEELLGAIGSGESL